MAKVFTRVRSWFMETGASGQYAEGVSSGSGQWACVRVMHAIARCCPDLLFAHPGLTLPLVFINTQVSPSVCAFTNMVLCGFVVFTLINARYDLCLGSVLLRE